MAAEPRIHRNQHTQQYVTIGNVVARDTRISYRAAGLLIAILSLPPTAPVTVSDLTQGCREGRESIRTALNELIGAGYVKRTKSQDKRGRWSTSLEVFETPQDVAEEDKPKARKPATRKQPKSLAPTPENPSPVPPAETPVIAGRTDAQKTDVGFLGAKELNNEELKTKDQSAREAEPLTGVVVAAPDPMIDMILSEVEERTNVKIPRDHAADVAAQILGRAPSKPRDPVKYVRAAIRREEDPRNFVPTKTPPPYRPVSVDPWATPPRPSTTDRAVRDAQALKAQMAEPPAETREHLEDPLGLNAQMAAMFGNRLAGRVA